MTDASYGQFCPVAMAAEVVCARWTPVLLRELLAGSTRFNELRRGAPRMSPALLSRRLKQLETAGIVERAPAPGAPGTDEYRLTDAGRELQPVIEALGLWGRKWVEASVSLENLDASLLMWDMRRNLNPRPLPRRRVVIQFQYGDQPESRRRWWLIVTPDGAVDLCATDPGFDVDLFAVTDLRTMTAIWMGMETLARAKAEDRLFLSGDAALERSMGEWLGFSVFAREPG